MNVMSVVDHHKIILGETILSWVNRGLSLGCLSEPHLFREAIRKSVTAEYCEPGEVSKWPIILVSDIEFDESSQLLSLCSDVYNISNKVLRLYFGSRRLPLTKLPYRSLSCEDCLSHSFISTRFPLWKKDWCYLTSAYCPIHLKALRSPPALPSIESRMWECYLHILKLERSPATYEEKRLALLAVKAQSWVQARALSHPSESEALHILYGLFLSRRTLYAVEGVAASGFAHPPGSPYRRHLNVQDRLNFGMHSSDGAQRGGALLLMGWLLELFQASDINGAIRCNRMVRRALPKNSRILGFLAARVFMTREEGEFVARKLQPLKDYKVGSMCDFLDALNVGVESLK